MQFGGYGDWLGFQIRDDQFYQDFAENQFGFRFNDVRNLLEALTHSSYKNEHPNCDIPNNERLEFLGDAILEMVVSDHLFRRTDHPEGIMTRLRASLVCEEALSNVAEQISVMQYMRLSRGQANCKGKARVSMLADCFEALIGAIYIDQGFEQARKFITSLILNPSAQIQSKRCWTNPKSQLQELTQRWRQVVPEYIIAREWGPDHEKNFEAEVYLQGLLLGSGTGRSKQEAQVSAAVAGLEKIVDMMMTDPIGRMVLQRNGIE